MLLAVCEATEIDCECGARIASGLGGGVGLQGEACGALTGGALVVGLLYGTDRADDPEAKRAAHLKAGELARRFGEANGALRCRDLIDLDVSTESAIEEYYARNLQEEVCAGVVNNAVRVLLELIGEWELQAREGES